MMTTIVKVEEHSKQLHECLKDGTCGIVDRGLGQCLISGSYCSHLRCPKLEDHLTQTANDPSITEKLK